MKSIWLASSRYTRLSGGLFHHWAQLSHLRSDLDSNFTIEAHLGANSQDFMENSLGGQRPKLASRAKVGTTQSFEVRFGLRLHH